MKNKHVPLLFLVLLFLVSGCATTLGQADMNSKRLSNGKGASMVGGQMSGMLTSLAKLGRALVGQAPCRKVAFWNATKNGTAELCPSAASGASEEIPAIDLSVFDLAQVRNLPVNWEEFKALPGVLVLEELKYGEMTICEEDSNSNQCTALNYGTKNQYPVEFILGMPAENKKWSSLIINHGKRTISINYELAPVIFAKGQVKDGQLIAVKGYGAAAPTGLIRQYAEQCKDGDNPLCRIRRSEAFGTAAYLNMGKEIYFSMISDAAADVKIDNRPACFVRLTDGVNHTNEFNCPASLEKYTKHMTMRQSLTSGMPGKNRVGSSYADRNPDEFPEILWEQQNHNIMSEFNSETMLAPIFLHHGTESHAALFVDPAEFEIHERK